LKKICGINKHLSVFPAIFNIARDPREQMNQIGPEAWVIAPYLKIVGQYVESLKEYPNPDTKSLLVNFLR